MMQLLMFLAAAAGPSPGGPIGDQFSTHAMGGPDPTHMVLLPPRIPDCRSDEEVRKALAEKAQGLPQTCDPPKPQTPDRRGR